ncbi:unnamed protein product [Ceutorhynchus assimilis]|uniref:B3/B4 tRNA-binding domain-containing protein n=1 Tax=Ceutorhynchus assimilis TaxID=467358 RepID=A0A9N9MWH1_9CUCU|nr:unnamed protein product [Ceutorhynchus assimilis]
MWPEIRTAKNEKRRELVLGGSEISQRIEKDGFSATIYELTDLNYLSITDTSLSEISSDIAKLESLQTLILHSNKFRECNEAITKLSKLKILDLSRNSIERIPESIASLSQIITINISNNKLESFPTLSNNAKLTVVDLSCNALTTFPNLCNSDLVNLSELKLQGNHIDSIPSNINVLPSLKVMDVSNNKIKILPGELADCHKLKEINLKSNPISDRRLFKLIDQCRTKQIIDYVKQNCPRATKDANSNPKPGKKGAKTKQKSDDSESNEDELSYKYTITVKPANEDFKVVVENSTKTIREHIVCCLVNNIVFTEDTFKEFIKLQNKLHDGICEKRNAATIATHDYKKLDSSIIKYTTLPPSQLKLKPLYRATEMSGAELFARLQTEADNLRKEKKRNTYSGIHKYLYLVAGKPTFPCLVNEKGDVISFPPITNSDITKIEPTTTQIFIEVTSSLTQVVCKAALNEIIKELVNLLGTDLEVQQVRILDQEEKLRLVYPGKNDLKFGEHIPIKVTRIR